jgi:hypothetical protein
MPLAMHILCVASAIILTKPEIYVDSTSSPSETSRCSFLLLREVYPDNHGIAADSLGNMRVFPNKAPVQALISF